MNGHLNGATDRLRLDRNAEMKKKRNDGGKIKCVFPFLAGTYQTTVAASGCCSFSFFRSPPVFCSCAI